MKIVAGLGNPGREYAHTPHNAGFRAADALALSLGAAWKTDAKWKAQLAKARLGATQIVIAKPQTFMNASGDSIAPLAAFHKATPQDVIVLVDEVNLAPGRIRIRPSGSAGGHNGLKSIAERLGSSDFVRVRIGVGMGHHPVPDLAVRVLGRIEPEDETAIADGIRLAAEAALCLIEKGIDYAMNKYNGPETIQS